MMFDVTNAYNYLAHSPTWYTVQCTGFSRAPCAAVDGWGR
jgi:hypothetical protein